MNRETAALFTQDSEIILGAGHNIVQEQLDETVEFSVEVITVHRGMVYMMIS